MRKSILITIIILSVLSVYCGVYVVYNLVFSNNNKCDYSLVETDTENDGNEINNEINSENDISDDNLNAAVNDNPSQNVENESNKQDFLNVSKVREKDFDVNNISKIALGRFAFGIVKYEEKVVDDNETIKKIYQSLVFNLLKILFHKE